MERLLIGVAGGSGSGKSTLVQRLAGQFSENVSVLYMDNYYKDNGELSLEERKQQNYDYPMAFDLPLLLDHLKALKAGKTVEMPLYDFGSYRRQADTQQVEARQVILVDGILLFTDRRIRELMNIKIFVDTDADVRALRRVRRDVESRGRTLDEAIEQYLSTVKPMHEAFVEPTKHFADLVVLEGGENQVATDTLIAKIRSHLRPQ